MSPALASQHFTKSRIAWYRRSERAERGSLSSHVSGVGTTSRLEVLLHQLEVGDAPEVVFSDTAANGTAAGIIALVFSPSGDTRHFVRHFVLN